MSKTSQSIKMLKILASRDKVPIFELASMLETNPRNIPEYRMVLEEAGYIIHSVRGPAGGYMLDKDSMLPVPKLKESEKQALFKGLSYLLERQDFMEIKEYEKAMQNVLTSTIINEEVHNIKVLNKYPLAMSSEDIEKRYTMLENAIKNKKKVEIEYISLKNKETKRIIHPYKLFMYNNAWLVIANDEKSNQIKYFKLNRIKSFNLLTANFRISYAYNEKDFIDSYGLKQNGEWYAIKLKLFNQYALLATERVYGKNQSIKRINENTVVLSCEMQNKENVKNFVLGFGDNCEIIEPKWLIDEIKQTCKNLIKKYK